MAKRSLVAKVEFWGIKADLLLGAGVSYMKFCSHFEFVTELTS